MAAMLAGASSLPAQEAPAVAPGVPAAPLEAPSAPAKPTGLMRWLDPAVAPFIPIPEIDVDPQSGVTLGVIATFLHVNDRNEIERITAPDVFHSQYFGWGAGISMYGYPSDDDQWLVVGSVKERVERDLDVRYLAGQTRATPLSWSVETLYDRSGTARFFGIGNETPDYNESTYVDDQVALAATIGYNFTQATQLAYGARYLLYGGFASRSLGSSVAYSFFGAEARCYFPLGEHITLALHAAARYMPSAAEAPFWALSSLGGDRSVVDGREPLRSDGANRFVDENLIATGAELRTRVAGFDAFGTRVSLELAPFVDTGKVFSNGPGSLFSDMHTAAGIGVRGVASPFVVGYVDVGYGRGKAVVFSGIGYPF